MTSLPLSTSSSAVTGAMAHTGALIILGTPVIIPGTRVSIILGTVPTIGPTVTGVGAGDIIPGTIMVLTSGVGAGVAPGVGAFALTDGITGLGTTILDTIGPTVLTELTIPILAWVVATTDA